MALIRGLRRRMLFLSTWLLLLTPSWAGSSGATLAEGAMPGVSGNKVLLLKLPRTGRRQALALGGAFPYMKLLGVAARMPSRIPAPGAYVGPMAALRPWQAAKPAARAIPAIPCTGCTTRTGTNPGTGTGTGTGGSSCPVQPPPPPPPPPPPSSPVGTTCSTKYDGVVITRTHTYIHANGPTHTYAFQSCCMTPASDFKWCNTISTWKTGSGTAGTTAGTGGGGGGGGCAFTTSGCCSSTYPCSPVELEVRTFRTDYATG